MEKNNEELKEKKKEEFSQSPESLQNTISELQKKARELKKQLPKKFRKKILPQSLSDEEFRNLISAEDKKTKSSKKIKVCFLLAYESGLRISEVLKLQKEDINLTAKTIFVREGKFSKDRIVPLPKTWRNWMIDFIPFDYKNIRSGSRALEIAFKIRAKKAKLNPRYHFHSLRHSFATHCLERGMPINQVQILMGHSSVATTNVYIQANPKDALNKYQEIF